MSDKRIEIEEIIFKHSRSVSNHTDNRYKWKDVQELLAKANITLQPNDILEVGFTEGWDEGDSYREDMYDLSVKRNRPETDEEYNRRRENHEIFLKASRDRRYENFIKLKQEFEPEKV